MLIQQLKRFDADTLALDELIELAALARILHTEYENASVEVPDWLTGARARIRRAVAVKVADDLEKKISEARSRRAALATTEEKRQKLDEELAKLEAAQKALSI